MAKQVVEGLTQLDPSVILADENSRFGLKRLRIESLMQSILEQGGVMQPVEVEPIEGAGKGEPQYRLTAGFYRHAAVSELNEKQNAGLTLPAIVKPLGDPTMRLKRQLAENMERENQSPMDKAIAIKKLEDAGVPRLEIRKIFSTPGGRKGLSLQPASNAFINMTLSFLDLPKAIQEKIHDGRVGVAAAYELTKVSPDKRADVLERAEADRIKAIEVEEKDEEKYLNSIKKAEEAKAKEAAAAEALKKAEADIEAAKKDAEELLKVAAEKYQAAKVAKGEEKAKAEEAFKAAESFAKAADKKVETLTGTISKLSAQSEKAAKLAAEKLAQLANARKTAKADAANKGKQAVGSKDVKKAAAAEGASTQYVKLNATEMRRIIDDLALAPGSFPKVREIMKAIKSCFDGVTTDRQLYSQLATLTGEKKGSKKEAA